MSNIGKKNQDSLDILKRSFDTYKVFLDNPTKKNLDNFLKFAEAYKEAFIEDAGTAEKTSSADLIAISDYETTPSTITRRSLSKHNNLNSYQRSPLASLEKTIRRLQESGKPLNQIQLLNRLINHSSTFLGRPLQNKQSIATDERLKERPDLYHKFSGPIKLIAKHIQVPRAHLDYFGLEAVDELNYVEFSISKYKYYQFDTRPSKDDKKSGALTGEPYIRPIVRRWNVETDSSDADNLRISAWLDKRNDVESLLNAFMNRYSNSELDGLDLKDSRLSTNQLGNLTTISSTDLSLEDRETIFKEITLDETEYELLVTKFSNPRFLITETSYPKTSRQMLNTSEVEFLWRDVCIFNDDTITIRSFTNDKSFVPKVPSYSGSDAWVFSNEMPKLSWQSISYFAKELQKNSAAKTPIPGQPYSSSDEYL